MKSLREVNFIPFMEKAAKNVFETMLGLNVSLVDGSAGLQGGERVMGHVGVAGKVAGYICLTFSSEFSRFIAATMLGLDAEEIGHSEVTDVIGELCNMVGGNIKSRLCDLGFDCVLTIPSVTSGTDFRFQTLKEPIVAKCVFETESHLWQTDLFLKEQI